MTNAPLRFANRILLHTPNIAALAFATSVLASCNLMGEEPWYTLEKRTTIGSTVSCTCQESQTTQDLGYSVSGPEERHTTEGANCAKFGYTYTESLGEGDKRYDGPNGGTQPGANGFFASGAGCLVGSWTRSICGGTAVQTLTFGGNGTGSFADKDCTSQCNRFAPFTYSVTNGVAMITYGSGTICNQPFNPSGGSQSFSCSGNTLVMGNTYTRS